MLLTSCELRFSEASDEARLGQGLFCFVFSTPWEYKQHLLSTYLPNVSSLIVSRDVLAGFFVTTGKKVSIMTTKMFSLSSF